MISRLQKIIASRGYCSRRKAEELIELGKVKVDGITVDSLGSKFDEDKVVIEIEGKKLLPSTSKKHHYYLLNKPLGYICSNKDDRGRKEVASLIDVKDVRLFPVGRLDINTSGALILTDDGEFANLVMHPSSSFEKTYKVVIDGQLTSRQAHQLEEGVKLEDGMTSKAKVEIILISQERSIFELTIHEGRNRQVRRMVEAIGHNTLKLSRVRIGPLSIKGIEVGKYIPIEESKIKEIKNLCLKNKRNNSYKKIAK